MQNHISLRPNPTATSYLRHFQIAQLNLNLVIEEEKQEKKRSRYGQAYRDQRGGVRQPAEIQKTNQKNS